MQTVVNAQVRSPTTSTRHGYRPEAQRLPFRLQSNLLTVTTGIATANSFSLAVGCYNIERRWDYGGTTTTVTALVWAIASSESRARYYSARSFNSDGGNIGAAVYDDHEPSEGGAVVPLHSQLRSPARPAGSSPSGERDCREYYHRNQQLQALAAGEVLPTPADPVSRRCGNWLPDATNGPFSGVTTCPVSTLDFF